MSVPIIVVHGFLGSGKSTFGNFVIEEHGLTRNKFAQTLKNMIRVLLRDAGVSNRNIERYVEGTTEEKATPIPELRGVTGRHLMETLGENWRDLVYTSLWVDINDARIERLIENPSINGILIDDLRYEHEIESLKAKYGERSSCKVVFVKIKGSNYEQQMKAREDGTFSGTKGEMGIPDHHFDVVVENKGTLEDLRRQALDLVERLW